eukprot:m.223871 g.223871  ORF g.223871 m.223871 type:complete len:442 (-) comp18762_c1_seq1:26-1351(-)
MSPPRWPALAVLVLAATSMSCGVSVANGSEKENRRHQHSRALGNRGTRAGTSTCQTAWDCHLNGVCSPAGRCVCDVAWDDGGNCSTLQLQANEMTACGPGCAYHGSGEAVTSTSWGGNSLRVGNKYYLAVAEMANNCSLGTWLTNSQVAMTVADSPAGPYRRLYTAIHPWFHNPQLMVVPGSSSPPTYLIYGIGNGTKVQPLQNCSHQQPQRQQQNAGVPQLQESTHQHRDHGRGDPPPRLESTALGDSMLAVYTATSIMGPWSRVNITLEQAGGMLNKNPSPVIFPNGTVRLMALSQEAAIGSTVFEASHWQGPYRHLSDYDVAKCTKKVFKWCAEDPFMYQDARSHWHALFHRFQGADHPDGAWTGGHAFSYDGLVWSNMTKAYNMSLWPLDIVAERRERPKLLFASDGHTPLYLFNGVDVPGYGTYTMATRISQSQTK